MPELHTAPALSRFAAFFIVNLTFDLLIGFYEFCSFFIVFICYNKSNFWSVDQIFYL